MTQVQSASTSETPTPSGPTTPKRVWCDCGFKSVTGHNPNRKLETSNYPVHAVTDLCTYAVLGNHE